MWGENMCDCKQTSRSFLSGPKQTEHKLMPNLCSDILKSQSQAVWTVNSFWFIGFLIKRPAFCWNWLSCRFLIPSIVNNELQASTTTKKRRQDREWSITDSRVWFFSMLSRHSNFRLYILFLFGILFSCLGIFFSGIRKLAGNPFLFLRLLFILNPSLSDSMLFNVCYSWKPQLG